MNKKKWKNIKGIKLNKNCNLPNELIDLIVEDIKIKKLIKIEFDKLNKIKTNNYKIIST